MKEETILTIAKWSEETFGDNITLYGQIDKFDDEYKEWLASDRQDIMELADMAIVVCSIARFSMASAMIGFQEVLHELEKSDFMSAHLEDAINKKMAINRKRKWSVGKGNYQHIEEGGEE